MKVLCVRIINPATRQEVLEHPAVRVGEEYHVVSVSFNPRREASFQIITLDGTPAWFDAAMFHAIEGDIPRSWVMSVHERGIVDFGPAPLLKPGFWERYFDDDPDAIAVFESVMRE